MERRTQLDFGRRRSEALGKLEPGRLRCLSSAKLTVTANCRKDKL